LIIFDASSLVGVALKVNSIPAQAFTKALLNDRIALSSSVDGEIASVMLRPKFASKISAERRDHVLRQLRERAAWFEPSVTVSDCRDVKDNKYLELAIAAEAGIIVSSDDDLTVLDPWRGIRILRPADYLRQHTNFRRKHP